MKTLKEEAQEIKNLVYKVSHETDKKIRHSAYQAIVFGIDALVENAEHNFRYHNRATKEIKNVNEYFGG